MADSAKKRTFQAAVCQYFGCAPAAYEETVLRHSLYPHASSLATLVRRFSPSDFRSDFDLIRAIAEMTDTEEILAEVRLHRAEHPPATLLRRYFRIRLSGQRLLGLSAQVFAQQSTSAKSQPHQPGP